MDEDKKQAIRDLIEQEEYDLARKQLQQLAVEDDEAAIMLTRLNKLAPPGGENSIAARRNKNTAGIIAIFLGGFGLHKFYLGKTMQGILYLLFFWSLIPAILGIYDGIVLLTMSDSEFWAKYGPSPQIKRVEQIENKKESRGCSRRLWLIPIFGLIGFFILVGLFGEDPKQDTSDGDTDSEVSVVDENDSEDDSSEVDRTEFISTATDEFEIPGTGYMDGRDPEADPPITLMSINIWDTFDRSKVECELEHGTEVELLAAEYVDDESRYYLKVKHESCEGWVPDPFVSTQKHSVLGDTFP